MALEQVIADSVRSLGFDLVELERLAGGLLRVTIDVPWQPDTTAEKSVGVDDCEQVSHQLQYALEVEGVDYKRLEVSSPGIDRPLRHAADFARFSGERVELKFRAPVNAAGGEGRKVFCGTLGPAEDAEHWQIAWSPEAKAADRKLRGHAPHRAEVVHVMTFSLDELASARLAPVLDFKRVRKPRGARSGRPAADVQMDPTE